MFVKCDCDVFLRYHAGEWAGLVCIGSMDSLFSVLVFFFVLILVALFVLCVSLAHTWSFSCLPLVSIVGVGVVVCVGVCTMLMTGMNTLLAVLDVCRLSSLSPEEIDELRKSNCMHVSVPLTPPPHPPNNY